MATFESLRSPVAEGALVSGRYQLTAPLGAGGMGWVFLAHDTTLDNQEVALKFLYPHLLSDPHSFSRFRNEVLVARKLIHPNIVRTFNMGIDDGQAYIVMEYIQGQTLKGALQAKAAGGFASDRALSLALDICRGVCHSHALGIIHRDLKPDNVLVTAQGLGKLSDFGLAATLRRQGNFTKVGQLLGTPYYMAPEQFRGEPPDERSDIYAFGILLFELLVGRVPFEDDSLYGLAMKHATETIVLPDGLNTPVTPEMWAVIQRATHKKPAARFSNAEELLKELEQITGTDAVLSGERSTSTFILDPERADDPPPYEIRKSLRRAFLPLLFLTLAIGIPWVRLNASAQSRVRCGILLIEKHTRVSLDPLYQLFGIAPSFKHAPLATLGDSEIWPRVYAGDNPDAPENRHPEDGRTALHVATENASDRIVTYLLKYGASPSAVAHDGRTPLHTAVRGRDPKIVKLLLDRGVDPNPRLATQETPLHIAVRQKNVAIVSLLRERGADPLLKDKFGWSPAMYAVNTGDTALVDAMLKGLPADQLPLPDLATAAPLDNTEAVRAYFVRNFGSSPF